MSKPNNSISKIKLPGENTGRPIVPYYVGYSESNNYVVTLPQLTEDNTHFVIDKQDQDIYGHKIFMDWMGLYDYQNSSEIRFWAADGFIYFYNVNQNVTLGFNTVNEDLQLEWTNYNGDNYGYSFPTQSGTLGLQIDIVDLTSL